MARLVRPKQPTDYLTSETLDNILESNVIAENSGVLVGHTCASIRNTLFKNFGKTFKGVKFGNFKHFVIDDDEEVFTKLKLSEHAASVSVDLDKGLVNLIASTVIGIDFSSKAFPPARSKVKIPHYQSATHVEFVYLHASRFVRLRTVDGSVILYIPKNKAEITSEFRKNLISENFQIADLHVCVPNIKLENSVELSDFAQLEGTGIDTDIPISLGSYELRTQFDMVSRTQPLPPKAKKVATKNKARVIKFDKPFVIVVERDGVEVFAAAVNRNSWIKS